MVRALGCAGCELKPDEFLQQSRGWLAVLHGKTNKGFGGCLQGKEQEPLEWPGESQR